MGDLVIYTVGHGNTPLDEFLSLLQKHGIQVLVDVRSAPYSRYASQFNKASLEAEVPRAGIAYRYAGKHLGGRPQDPTCYRSGQLPDDSPDAEDFLKLVDYDAVEQRDWYQRGIARLIEIASENATAIMCSEEDPQHCHRHHLITKTLQERGITVRHIRRNGPLETPPPVIRVRQMSMFDSSDGSESP